MSAPESSFYIAGGTLRPDARSYVERQADKDLLDALMKGEFCYALTSRQMGKSSLMVRTVKRLREHGVKVAVLDLTAIGQNLTAEQWYDGLLAKLGQQLDLEDPLETFWRSQERLGPLQRWSTALEKVVLRHLSGQIVIFVDELDVVRSLSFSTDEFFATIRECFNRRSEDREFDRLTFCLLGVATPTDLIRDARLTPFNIGRRLELDDFTEAEAQGLAAGLNRNEQIALRLLQRIRYWTGGHPYLTQRLCRAVGEDVNATSPADVDRHCDELFLSVKARERDDNLIFVRDRILSGEVDRASVLDSYGRVLRGKAVPDDDANPLVSILRLSGITRGEAGRLKVRNRIYQRVFNKNWIASNLPDAEVRRQQLAFRRGAVRATALSLIGLVALIAVVSFERSLGQVQSLPDGSTLFLKKITYGNEHVYEPGYFRLGWIREFVPSPLKRFFWFRSVAATVTSDELVFWVVRRGPSVKQSATQDQTVRWHPVTFDEDGCELAGRPLIVSFPLQKEELAVGWRFSAFPRRGKMVGFRLYDRDQSNQWFRVAEFKAPNPTPGPHPSWKPERVPITKQVGDLAFTLNGLFTGTSQILDRGQPRPASNTEKPGTIATFQIAHQVQPVDNIFREGSPPTNSWLPISMEAHDATGNMYSPLSGSGGANAIPGGAGRGFDLTLLAEETIKLRVTFQHNISPALALDQLSSEEYWTIKDVVVPEPHTTTQRDMMITRRGLTVRLLGIAGTQAFMPDGIQNSWDFPTVHFIIGPIEHSKGHQVIVTDQKGNRLTPKVLSYSIPANVARRGESVNGFEFPPGTKSVDVTFIIPQVHVVDFLVKPERLKAPTKESK